MVDVMRYDHRMVEDIDCKNEVKKRYSQMYASSDGEFVTSYKYDQLQVKYQELKDKIMNISEDM